MKNLLILSALLFSSLAYSSEKIVPLDIKLGLWESVMDKPGAQGQIPQMAEILKGLKGPARAAVMKAMALQKKKSPKASRSCITRENLKDFGSLKAMNNKVKDGACKMVISKSTSTFLGIREDCTNPMHNRKMETTVVNSKKIIIAIHSAGSVIKRTISAKWISSTCSN